MLKNEPLHSNNRRMNNIIAKATGGRYVNQKERVISVEIHQTRVRSRAYQAARKVIDPAFKITSVLRNSIRDAIKRGKGTKSGKTEELLGCSVSYAMEWIAASFKDGMTWENHGEWHIDHIVPCSVFDLTDPEQQKQCFNYRNLQALWAKENLSKNSWHNGRLVRKYRG